MTTANTLPQLANTVEIVGTLKEINIESKISAAKNKYVRGIVTVVSKTDNKVHEHRISVMVMESSKLIKGIRTMMAEYKSIESHGEENADRIKVTGEIELEEYYNKKDVSQFISFNKVKGVFFNRLDETTDQPDKAMASIEVIVKGFTPEIDSETGEILYSKVNAFTVGYGEKVVELKKAIVGLELANAFQDLYPEGSTGRLTFKLNNYVELADKEVTEAPVSMSHGFGSEETVEESKVFKKFTNNLEITGGDMPLEEPKAFTPEQIQSAERSLALAREALKAAVATQAAATPQTNTGFGADVSSQMPVGMGPLPTLPAANTTLAATEDDMPDF